jgi:hypothetical protein
MAFVISAVLLVLALYPFIFGLPGSGAPPLGASIIRTPRQDTAPRRLTVRVELRGLPASASVVVDGRSTRGPIVLLPRDGRPHKIHVTAEGYRPWQGEHIAEDDATLVVRLERSAEPDGPIAVKQEPTGSWRRMTGHHKKRRPEKGAPPSEETPGVSIFREPDY